MPGEHVNVRVQKHRAALRVAGLRPVQIWVTDTRRPDFAQECLRQCLAVAKADENDLDTRQLLDHALSEIEGWAE